MNYLQYREIPRPTIVRLLGLLSLVGVDYSSRDYDAELFRVIDSRPVRRTTVMDNDVTLSALAGDALDAAIALRELLPVVREDWVSETHALEVDYVDDIGAKVVDMGRHGYFRADGVFVESPLLELVPHYTTKADDALNFKDRVLGSYLLLAAREENNADWGTDYSVCLLEGETDVIYTHRARDLPQAIVGAVLGAVLTGWRPNLLPFGIKEDRNYNV